MEPNDNTSVMDAATLEALTATYYKKVRTDAQLTSDLHWIMQMIFSSFLIISTLFKKIDFFLNSKYSYS